MQEPEVYTERWGWQPYSKAPTKTLVELAFSDGLPPIENDDYDMPVDEEFHRHWAKLILLDRGGG